MTEQKQSFEVERVHIMVDLETLDTKPGAAITAIGATVFDPERTDRIIRTYFHQRASLEDAVRNGTVSGSTLRFWIDQSPEAQKEILTESSGPGDMSFVDLIVGFA